MHVDYEFKHRKRKDNVYEIARITYRIPSASCIKPCDD